MKKQMKVLVLTLIVLMGVGFTSCMNSDGNTTMMGYSVVKVHSSFGVVYFEDASGFKYYPTTTSLAQIEANPFNFKTSSTNLAYIGYQYDTETQQVTESTTKLNVELNYAVSLDAKLEIVNERGAENDSIANAPIITLKGTANGYYNYEPVMFDSNTLLLSVNYFMNINKPFHYFTLVYYPNEEPVPDAPALDGEGNTVTLYLRHNSGDDTSNSATSLGYVQSLPSVFYKAFDLSSLRLSPNTKLIINTIESSNSLKLEDGEEKQYEVAVNAEK